MAAEWKNRVNFATNEPHFTATAAAVGAHHHSPYNSSATTALFDGADASVGDALTPTRITQYYARRVNSAATFPHKATERRLGYSPPANYGAQAPEQHAVISHQRDGVNGSRWAPPSVIVSSQAKSANETNAPTPLRNVLAQSGHAATLPQSQNATDDAIISLAEQRVTRTKSCTPSACRSLNQSNNGEQVSASATQATVSSSSSAPGVDALIMKSAEMSPSASAAAVTSSASPNKAKNVENCRLRKKWMSAFHVVQSITRFKNIPSSRFSMQSESSQAPNSNGSTPCRIEEPEIDPIYLALKQATGKYGSGSNGVGGGSANGSRRGSSVTAATFAHVVDDSSTPSPRNLSQTSLQDSGYAETYGNSRGQLIGSTPQLCDVSAAHATRHSSYNGGASPTTFAGASCLPGVMSMVTPNSNARVGGRRPKLSEKMKSLSLDCAETLPPTSSSAFRPDVRLSSRGLATSGETLAYNPSTSLGARQLPVPVLGGSHVCIHDYIVPETVSLHIGDRLSVVDNGDPDWQHGFKVNDRLQNLLTFPKTCVAAIEKDEQPMKLLQNVNIIESKLRLYRDQVVFAQPDSIRDNGRQIQIRTEHNAFAHCPIKYLTLL